MSWVGHVKDVRDYFQWCSQGCSGVDAMQIVPVQADGYCVDMHRVGSIQGVYQV